MDGGWRREVLRNEGYLVDEFYVAYLYIIGYEKDVGVGLVAIFGLDLPVLASAYGFQSFLPA